MPVSNALRRYAEIVTRHPWTVLILSLLGMAVITSGARRLVVNLDPEQQLPANNHYIAVDRQIRKEFGGKNFVAIAVVPRAGSVWRPDVLQAVYGLTRDALRMPGIISQNVTSLFSPYVRVPKDRGGTLAIDYLARAVPADQRGIAALRTAYRSEPLFRGTLVSADERAALVLLDFYDGTKAADIAARVERAVAKYRSPTLRIAVTGTPIFDGFEATIVRNQGFYFAAAVVAILLVLYLAFGQVQGVVLPTATALLSTLAALGFMGYAGISLNPWTTAVPMVVVTVAAGHSAQMLKRYYEEFRRLGTRDAAVVESASKIGVVMMAAGGTAASGFAALSILGIPTLTSFGLGVACGIFAAVVLEMTFMLALRVLWPTGRATSGEGPLSRWLDVVLQPLQRAVARHPLRVAGCFLGAAALAAAGYPRLTTAYTTRTYWSARSEIGRDLRVFDAHFPSTTTLTVLLEGAPGSMKTPEAIRLMTGLQRAMAADPDVGRSVSLADFVRRTFEVFAPDQAVHGLPADRRLIAQLFFLTQSPALEGYVNRAYSRSVVRAFLNSEDSRLTHRVIDRLTGYLAQHPAPSIHVALAGGVGPTIMALNDDMVTGKVLNIAILLVVIFLIASLLLRSAIGGAYVVAPLAVALIVNLGIFSWLRIPFDLSGASIAAIGVGIGADYAIYFLYRLNEELPAAGSLEKALARSLETSGRAVLFVALAISAGFGVYMASDFYPLEICGWFIPITMIVSALTALTLVPALVLLWRPRFVLVPPTLPVVERRAGLLANSPRTGQVSGVDSAGG